MDMIIRRMCSLPWIDAPFGGGIAVPSLTVIGGPTGIGRTIFLVQLLEVLRLKHPALYLTPEGSDVAGLKVAMARAKTSEGVLRHVILESVRIPELKDASAIAFDALSPAWDPKTYIGLMKVLRACVDRQDIPSFVVSPMTRDGDYWGPVFLQQVSDTLLTLDRPTEWVDGMTSEEIEQVVVLNVWKNRFGPTYALNQHLLRMTEAGFVPIVQPKKTK